MEEYKGSERRGVERRDIDHCSLHHENSQKIDTLLSSERMMKWVVGIGIPLLFGAAVIFYQGNQDALKGVSSDLKEVKNLIVANQVDAAVIKSRLDAHEQQIQELNDKVDRRHP
jgi:hypothetical protein